MCGWLQKISQKCWSVYCCWSKNDFVQIWNSPNGFQKFFEKNYVKKLLFKANESTWWIRMFNEATFREILLPSQAPLWAISQNCNFHYCSIVFNSYLMKSDKLSKMSSKIIFIVIGNTLEMFCIVSHYRNYFIKTTFLYFLNTFLELHGIRCDWAYWPNLRSVDFLLLMWQWY